MKHSRLKVALATSALLVSALAVSATIRFSWVNPTQNTDGSAIPASGPGSIQSTVVSYGPCNAGKTALASITGTITIAGQATFGDSPNLPPGDWCGFAQSVNTYGITSDPSNVGSKTVAPPKPNPPSNFTLG